MPITSLIARALLVCSITLAIALPSTPVHAANKASLQKQTKQKKKKASTHKKRSPKLINKLKHSVKAKSQSEDVHYVEWKEVLDFIEHMHTQHQFEREQLRLIFEQVRYVESAVQFIKPAPPGKPKNWKAYRARFVENGRIEAGVAFWERNNEALNRAQERFGVPAEIIVGLIGVETIFGKNTGSFRAIDALTTLAFSYPDTPTREARMEFFKNELAQLLLWTRERNFPLFDLKGSYAGAIGLAQFMPSSLRNFSIDFDGDGNIDLKQSQADAIGSVANYLSLHGWKKDLPYAFPATLSSEQVDEKQLQEVLAQGLKASYRLDQLYSLVSTADALAPKTINYGLIDLQNGNDPTEYWFATENFFAITRYNRSYFYAMSVIDLGQVIRLAKQKPE